MNPRELINAIHREGGTIAVERGKLVCRCSDGLKAQVRKHRPELMALLTPLWSCPRCGQAVRSISQPGRCPGRAQIIH
jgi:rubrerythrin